MADLKVVGLFSVGRDGEHCLHEGESTKEEAERIRTLLNKSVTGGPYKMFLAIAAPIAGAPKSAPPNDTEMLDWLERRNLLTSFRRRRGGVTQRG